MNSLVRARRVVFWAIVVAAAVTTGATAACVPDVPRGPSVGGAPDSDGGTGRPRIATQPVAINTEPVAGGGAESSGAETDGGDARGPVNAEPRERNDDADAGDARDLGSDVETYEVAGAGRAPEPGEVLITELLINPNGADSGREWIEIRNASAVALDLGGLHIADSLSEVAVAAGVLPPGRIALLGQSLDVTKNGGVMPDARYGTISLNNDRDSITLCQGACADGVVLDSFTWTALGAASDGHSAMLDPPGPTERRFCFGTESFGTGGSFGTPGQPQALCPPPP